MSVMRIGEIMQPAWSRTAAALAEATVSFVSKLQAFIGRTMANSQEASKLIAALLSPAALISLVLGMWRLGADLGWTDQFVISDGLFSHWQVWIALAFALETAASTFLRSHQKPGSSEQH